MEHTPNLAISSPTKAGQIHMYLAPKGGDGAEVHAS